MNLSGVTIVPLTQARNKLGNLTRTVRGEEYVILTKGGAPKAALVDINYLTKLETTVRKLYQKTFIRPKLLPYTRQFSAKEIIEWEKEDTL